MQLYSETNVSEKNVLAQRRKQLQAETDAAAAEHAAAAEAARTAVEEAKNAQAFEAAAELAAIAAEAKLSEEEAAAAQAAVEAEIAAKVCRGAWARVNSDRFFHLSLKTFYKHRAFTNAFDRWPRKKLRPKRSGRRPRRRRRD
jgi:hypothetical protein